MDEFTIDIDGATLTGVEMGDGLPVVFLHAGVCDNRMWHDQMRLAADNGWHAIAYDRRGYGDAESPDEPFSHLEDLEAILDAFDIHAAIFVGCSMGGGLAIDFALSHPGRVIGLVLIGTSVTGAPWSATAEESAIEMAEEDAWERGDLDLLNKVQAHEWLDGPRAQSGRVGGSVRELFLDMNAKALAKPELTQEEPRPDAWSRVDAVTSPTMLIVGDEDFLRSSTGTSICPRPCPIPSLPYSKAWPISPASNGPISSIGCSRNSSMRWRVRIWNRTTTNRRSGATLIPVFVPSY